MKHQLQRLRFVGIVFIYFLAACLTFVDKLTFINGLELGINKDYWYSNAAYLSSVVFWFNMFLFSILPVILSSLIIKDKIVVYSTYALPVYWGFILFIGITDTGSKSDVLIPDLKYFVYGFLFISGTAILIKLILIYRSLRAENTIDELERFKSRALRKLQKLDPSHNQKLLADVLGNHGEALNLLKAAYMEEDEKEKLQLMRMALNYVASEHESIETLQKRMKMYSRIEEE